jgi:hypothetical protein
MCHDLNFKSGLSSLKAFGSIAATSALFGLLQSRVVHNIFLHLFSSFSSSRYADLEPHGIRTSAHYTLNNEPIIRLYQQAINCFIPSVEHRFFNHIDGHLLFFKKKLKIMLQSAALFLNGIKAPVLFFTKRAPQTPTPTHNQRHNRGRRVSQGGRLGWVLTCYPMARSRRS